MRTDGGPAFPTQDYDRTAAQAGFALTVTDSPGMSLRDWFAGQALPTIIQVCAGDTRGDGESLAQLFARKAYGLADAMLEARALK